MKPGESLPYILVASQDAYITAPGCEAVAVDFSSTGIKSTGRSSLCADRWRARVFAQVLFHDQAQAIKLGAPMPSSGPISIISPVSIKNQADRSVGLSVKVLRAGGSVGAARRMRSPASRRCGRVG